MDREEELHFFFITLTIFQNGSIIIELFEDLSSSFYMIDFFHPFTVMKWQIFPDFINKKREYTLNSNYQIDDILKYIKKRTFLHKRGIEVN